MQCCTIAQLISNIAADHHSVTTVKGRERAQKDISDAKNATHFSAANELIIVPGEEGKIAPPR